MALVSYFWKIFCLLSLPQTHLTPVLSFRRKLNKEETLQQNFCFATFLLPSLLRCLRPHPGKEPELQVAPAAAAAVGCARWSCWSPLELLSRCCRSRESGPEADLPRRGCAPSLAPSPSLPGLERALVWLPLAAARKFKGIHRTLQRGVKAASFGWDAAQSSIQSLPPAPARVGGSKKSTY